MTPPPDTSVCPSCVLFQARGTTCPPVRPAYELEQLVKFGRLVMAVQADAGSVPSLADLIRRDAEASAGAKPVSALMPGATATEMFPDTEKEVEVVQAAKKKSSGSDR